MWTFLSSMLAESFPPPNLKGDENLEDLLSDLSALSVKTVDDLKRLLAKHRDAALSLDREEVSRRSAEFDYVGTTKERIEGGVFFSHVGLARQVLEAEFGDEARKVFTERGVRSVRIESKRRR